MEVFSKIHLWSSSMLEALLAVMRSETEVTLRRDQLVIDFQLHSRVS